MLFGLDAIPLTEPRAGIGHYTFELARALALAAPSDEFELAYPSSFPPINFGEFAESLPPNLKPSRVRVGALGKHWWSVGLPRHARRRGVALFHGTNYDVPLWGGAARVLTIHDLSLFLHPETHERRRVARARRRLPLMARAADAVIKPTESVRREVCEQLGVAPARVFAVPEAARDCFAPMTFEETEEVRRRVGAGSEFLLAVGTIEPRKNLSTLVAAFEKSAARERIVVAGYLGDCELRALYSSCRAFVYPSVYEGFGLPPLEAMRCGAPVVAGDIAAVAEVTNGAARLVNPRDASELARALVELLDDEGARRELSRAGISRAAEFSWGRTARMTLEVYAEARRRSRR